MGRGRGRFWTLAWVWTFARPHCNPREKYPVQSLYYALVSHLRAMSEDRYAGFSRSCS